MSARSETMEQTMEARRDILARLARYDLDESGCCHECYAAMEPSEHGEFVRFDSVIPIAGALIAAEAERDEALLRQEKLERALYRDMVGEDAPEGEPITDSWWTLVDRLKAAENERDRLAAALEQIGAWSRAYPLAVFPEPDMKRVRELLAAGGITLDAVSASNMRHAVEGVGRIARAALHPQQEPNDGRD